MKINEVKNFSFPQKRMCQGKQDCRFLQRTVYMKWKSNKSLLTCTFSEAGYRRGSFQLTKIDIVFISRTEPDGKVHFVTSVTKSWCKFLFIAQSGKINYRKKVFP